MLYFQTVKNTLLFALLLVFAQQVSAQTPVPDEAKKAFHLLNEIRQNPAAWSEACGVDLSYVEPRPALAWSDILAQVATEKAIDMATRGYFAHQDPDGYGLNIKMHEAGYTLIPDFIDHIGNYNFDNLAAGGTAEGEKFIISLILDEGVDPPGHRITMLGIDEFWANCTDVGIGIVEGQEGSQYGAYAVVIVAKHDF